MVNGEFLSREIKTLLKALFLGFVFSVSAYADGIKSSSENVAEFSDYVYFDVDLSNVSSSDLLKIDWYLGHYTGNNCLIDGSKLFFSYTLRGFAISKENFGMTVNQVNDQLASNMINSTNCLVMQVNSLTSDLCYRGQVNTQVNKNLNKFEISSVVGLKC